MFRFFSHLVSDRRGTSLIIALGLVMVLLLLGSGATAAVMTFMQTASQVERAGAAYFAAEGGIELALYDLAAYKDGYEEDATSTACVDGVRVPSVIPTITRTTCATSAPYRLTTFSNHFSTDTRTAAPSYAFWQLIARAPAQTGGLYEIPNPYFQGDKDGVLRLQDAADGGETEWGRLTKQRPVVLSLLADTTPSAATAATRFSYLDPSALAEGRLIIAIDPHETTSPHFAAGVSDRQDLLAWTLSAVDDAGKEYTLQGVVREDDFTPSCAADGSYVGGAGTVYCVAIDLLDDTASPDTSTAYLAGEDINKNIGGNDKNGSGADAPNAVEKWNRVSRTTQTFHTDPPRHFLDDMIDARSDTAWHDAQLSVSLIGTLSETSGIESDSLIYHFVARPRDTTPLVLADEYTYIVSEGLAGSVKQTIETKFRRHSTLSIFSYALFQ